MTVRLTKTADGGYATPDGRWTVQPLLLGTGVNANRGWSRGKRHWRVTDTTGQVRFNGRASVTVDALWRARDLIAARTEG